MAKSLGEIRREEITDAVLGILVESGPAELSTRSVAERVGLSKSSLYQHFNSLEDMITAAVAKLHDRITEIVESASAKAETPLEELRMVAEALPRMAPFFSVMPKLKFASLFPESDWCDNMLEHKQWFIEHLGSMLSRAQQAGELRTDITPIQALHLYGSLFREIVFMWAEHSEQESFDGEQMIRDTWELFIKLTRPGQEQAEYSGPERRRS